MTGQTLCAPPECLDYLVFTQTWERFSYYGMMMGGVYLVAFSSSTFASILSGLYEGASPAGCFALLAPVPVLAAIAIIWMRGPISRARPRERAGSSFAPADQPT